MGARRRQATGTRVRRRPGSAAGRGTLATAGVALLVAVSTGAAPSQQLTATARPTGVPVGLRPVISGVDGGAVPTVPPPAFPLPLPPPVVVALPGPPPVVPVDVGGARPPIAFVGGIPSDVLAAYQNAAAMLARAQPNCHLPVELLAAIGKVESGHARGGRLSAAGTAEPPILGPVLDGAGFAAIADTDHGTLDGDPVWDRAVGPMQFIPSTWRRWASDGNGDGVANPENVYDATLAAGRYLCAGGRDLSTDAGIQSAILSYNDSAAYLHLVSAWLTAYRGGITQVADVIMPASPTPLPPPTVSAPPPTTTTAPTPTTAPTTTAPTPPTTTPAEPPPPTTTGSGPVPPVPPTTTAPPITTTPPTTTAPPSGSLLCDVGGLLGGLLGLGGPPCPADDTQQQKDAG